MSKPADCGCYGQKQAQEDSSAVDFSQEQKMLVQDSWAIFSIGDQPQVVTDTTYLYVNLFRIRPDAAALFGFKEDDPLTEEAVLGNQRLKTHVGRVVKGLDFIVKNMYDLEEVGDFLHELGARHVKYRARNEFFQPIKESMLFAFERKLGSQFTPQVKQAWGVLLDIVTTHMQEGLREACAAKNSQEQ
ncbi:hypothetical protein BaRGS_00027602 [Batillaria attramentaria]|uniref:Globin n=1 Tax=Batillaria attramentaria TaxID=370345 RepID=A0ABD0K286_9CAEN